MATLHDALLAAATTARQRVSMRLKVHPGGLQHCCGLLWPRLEVQRRMARRRKLAAALQVGLLCFLGCLRQANQGCRLMALAAPASIIAGYLPSRAAHLTHCLAISAIFVVCSLTTQELQVQEGGDVSFLAADYQALLSSSTTQSATGHSDASGSSACDQQAAASARPQQQQAATDAADRDDGLTAAVGSIKQLFIDCCRFSTGATAVVQRHIPGLEKLLLSDSSSLQAAVEYMQSAV